MKLKNFLILTSIISVVSIIFLLICWQYSNFHFTGTEKFEYSKILLEIFKVIIIGFFVSIVIAIIPDLLQERKYEFEMRKEAKHVYSESLTGITYLNVKLPYFKTIEEAFKHIEELQLKKHLAETYYEYHDVKNKNAEFKQRKIWPPNLDPGKILEETKKKLEQVIDSWGSMSEKKRFEYFNPK